MKPTPTPWYHRNNACTIWPHPACEHAPTNAIAKTGTIANAHLIVRAVNCHEELVEALHDAAAQLNYIEGRLNTSRATEFEKANVPRALAKARVALAKARGGNDDV